MLLIRILSPPSPAPSFFFFPFLYLLSIASVALTWQASLLPFQSVWRLSMYNRAVSSVLRNTENVWRKRATEKSHQWALLGSWNNTIMHCTWESLPFCRNLFHLGDLQQMVWPLALLACLCLLVFKWTCSHNETSCRVSFLLSHFWSLGIHNSESRTCARSSVQDSCYLVLRPRLLRGAGGGGEIKGRNELLECCSDWSSLDAEQTCFGALQWEMSASTFLWDRWWDLLSVALYSLEWGIIYLRSNFPGIQALKVTADPFVISVSLKFMKTVLVFCVVPTCFATNAAFLSCSLIACSSTGKLLGRWD